MKFSNGLKIFLGCFILSTFLFGLFPLSLYGLGADQKYFIAERCYKHIKNNSKSRKYRHNWLKCIEKFQSVYLDNPSGPWAAAGLYMTGILYNELYRESGKLTDRKESLDIFERVTRRYPRSTYRKKAALRLKAMGYKRPRKITYPIKKSLKTKTLNQKALRQYKRKNTIISSSAKTLTSITDKQSGEKAGLPETKLTGIRYWSNPRYTRVVVDADSETIFNHHLLKPDPKLNMPRRLYVDLNNSKLGKDVKTRVPINDNLLIDARAAQYTLEKVRVVVDIKNFSKYKIFPLNNPFRIVIDVWGSGDIIAKTQDPKPAVSKGKIPMCSGALAKQLALGVRCIVIDPGHGGKDYGAPGYIKGVHEKDVVLQIAKKLACRIRKEIGCQVYLTREKDKFLTLEERTAIANTYEADLFISLHTNAHRDRRAYGVETYFLNLATDDEAIRVAARENATSRKNISDLEVILNDLMQNAKINESSRLAAFIQQSLTDKLKRHYKMIKDKGVKQAPFYVLLGAQMPAVLIESSFISNARECKRLINPTFQEHICTAVIKGVREYMKSTKPTAFLKNSAS